MKKNIFLLFLCFYSLQIMAQKNSPSQSMDKDTNQTFITGRLLDMPNDSLVMLYEPFSGDWDSTFIKNHEFRLAVPMSKGGSIYVIQIGDAKDQKKVLEKGKALVTYLDSGELHITGNNFNDAKLSGSPWVKEWNEVAKMTSPFEGDGLELAAINKKLNAARAIGDEDAFNAIAKDYMIIDTRIKNRYKDWMKNNPNSRLCGYLITCYLGGTNNKVSDSFYNSMSDRARESRIVRRWRAPSFDDKMPIKFFLDSSQGTGNIPGRPNIGTVAPVIDGLDVNDKKIFLSDFKGKYVLIDFWASWCAPCLDMVPSLKATYERFKGNDFEILGVSLDTKKEGWVKSMNKHELDWVNISNLKGWGDPASTVFGITAIPANVLIDPDGKIIGMNLFREALDKKLEELLNK